MLRQEFINFDTHTTSGYMDAWKYVQNLNLDEYSSIIAVGGDGTLHEVVNGMMFRQDKKKVPIAFVPNGTGNDTCKSLGIHDID